MIKLTVYPISCKRKSKKKAEDAQKILDELLKELQRISQLHREILQEMLNKNRRINITENEQQEVNRNDVDPITKTKEAKDTDNIPEP